MSKKSFTGVGKTAETGSESGTFLEDFLSTKSEKNAQSNQTEIEPTIKAKSSLPVRDKLTRQTFMIKESVLDRLKDFVHTKKRNEDYNYSQKQALEEALELLFGTITIEKRKV